MIKARYPNLELVDPCYESPESLVLSLGASFRALWRATYTIMPVVRYVPVVLSGPEPWNLCKLQVQVFEDTV